MEDSVKKIFDNLNIKATANYQDLEGQAALSWASTGHGDLEKIAVFQQIDVDKYRIHGINIFFSLHGISISFYISSLKNDDKQIRKVLTNITREDFFKFVDDFSIELFPRYTIVEGYSYEGEVDIENL